MQDGIRHMKCTECGREWEAVCYESSERLECPGCGYMVQCDPKNIFLKEKL
jgi:ribosomal protein S27E